MKTFWPKATSWPAAAQIVSSRRRNDTVSANSGSARESAIAADSREAMISKSSDGSGKCFSASGGTLIESGVSAHTSPSASKIATAAKRSVSTKRFMFLTVKPPSSKSTEMF